MKKLTLKNMIVSSLILASVFTLNPIGVSASWKHNNTGWWYSIDAPWVTGWKQIDGKWYYFNSNGYMAHDTIIDNYKLGSDGALVINQEATSASTTASNEKIVDVTVQTAQEFVNAIGSNKRIILKPGVYNLSSIEQNNNADNSVVWENVMDGKELNIQAIHNLTIEGMDSGKVEIKVSPRFATIMKFNNTSNITIKNIIAGHTPEPYECNAGVLEFNNSSDISIINSELYGCGSMGLDLRNVKRFEASNCTIDHCSLRAVQINNSEDIKFKENKIINHEAYSNIITLNGAKDVTFEQCEFANNNNFSWSFIEAVQNSNVLLDNCVIKNNSKSTNSESKSDNIYFFDTTDYFEISNSKITIKDSKISDNACDYLLDNKENVKFENCTINNNTWK